MNPDDLAKLLAHFGINPAPADATRVNQNIYKNDRTIGPATSGNIPLPQGAPPETREGWIMSHVADMLPVLGEARGLGAAHDLARQGHPLMGAAAGLAAFLPMGGRAAKSVAKAALREVEPEAFHEAVNAFAKARPSESGFLTHRTPDAMRAENMRTFLSADGKTGYALAPLGDGRVDIRNVFNHGEKGAGAVALSHALAQGGNVLDHFDTKLGDFYRQFGFKEYVPPGESAARLPWNPDYAPEGWDAAKHGTPDVVNQMHPEAGQHDPSYYLGKYLDAKPSPSTASAADDEITPWAPGQVRSVARPDPKVTRDALFDRLQKGAGTLGDSVAVRGAPTTMRVFHGTHAAPFDQFRVGHAPGWGDGIYFTDNHSQAASEFADGPGGRVITADVTMHNPYRGETIGEHKLAQTQAWKDVAHKWDQPADAWQEDSKFVGNALRELGYDGIIADGSNNISGKEIVAFHPHQIRQVAPEGNAIPANLNSAFDAEAQGPRTPAAPSIITKPTSGNVFDTSMLGSHLPPGFTDERPPLKYPTARTDVSMFDDLDRRFRRVYTPNAERALRDNPTSGGWYDTSQLRQAFVDASPSGAADFEQFMKFMGPTSTGTTVPGNIRQASKFYELWKSGRLSLDDLKNGTLSLPAGYANRRQSSLNAGILRILEQGNIDPIDQPKTYRYANQLAGHAWGGAALDMHVGRQVGKQGLLDAGDGQLVKGVGFPRSSYPVDRAIGSSPKNNQYAIIEDALVKEAKRIGLPPAVYQAAGWVGGAKKTGVADSRNFMDLMNQILKNSAVKYNHASPLDALHAFIKGQSPLWGIVGTLGLGGAAAAGGDDPNSR